MFDNSNLVNAAVEPLKEAINLIATEFPSDDKSKIESFVRHWWNVVNSDSRMFFIPQDVATRYRNTRK